MCLFAFLKSLFINHLNATQMKEVTPTTTVGTIIPTNDYYQFPKLPTDRQTTVLKRFESFFKELDVDAVTSFILQSAWQAAEQGETISTEAYRLQRELFNLKKDIEELTLLSKMTV
jgi:hypothetical protein